MEKPYQVEYIPGYDVIGNNKLLQRFKHVSEIELKSQMEALIIEKAEEGFDFVQMIESNRTNPETGMIYNGYFLVFKRT